jgi:hypothetical protein
MRNMPVPMDMSNRTRAPRQGQMRSNAAQVENPSWRQPRPCTCFNCGKEGHFQAQCRAPKKTQINSIIDKPKDMKGVQEALTPKGILDNALAMFNRMPDHMKDKFIQKYEGKLQDFQGV